MDDFIHVHAAGTFAQHGITGMQTVFQIRDGFRIRGEPRAILMIFKALDDVLCERADADKNIGAVFRRGRQSCISWDAPHAHLIAQDRMNGSEALARNDMAQGRGRNA